MLSDKVFKIALLISLSGHFILFYGWSGLAYIFPDKKAKTPLEVTYTPKSTSYELKENLAAKAATRRKIPPPIKNFKVKEKENPKEKVSTAKVITSRDETAIIPSYEILEASEEKSLYLDYYQSIREKIRGVANDSYHSHSREGEIYLSFVLESNGNLKNIRLFEHKSSSDDTLRTIALNSVKEASPFSAFPKGLNQKQLSFNVIISFEREN